MVGFSAPPAFVGHHFQFVAGSNTPVTIERDR
jgi:hypothetical protein